MKTYLTKNLRNIGIIGHSGAGKTTLTEAILYHTKAVDRLGKIEDGNTTSDYDPEEKKRQISVSTSIASCKWKDVKINLVDMPGYFDFVGEIFQGLRAVDLAMIVVSGISGIQVGTEKSWDYVNDRKIPKVFYINKLDRENSDFNKVLNDLKEKFGLSVVPIQYPIGKENNFKGIVNVISGEAKIFDEKSKTLKDVDVPEDILDKIDECKSMIMEAVAETDEELLDKYFNEGVLSDEDIYAGLIKGCSKGEVVPVMCGSASNVIGIDTLLENIIQCFPSPENVQPVNAENLKDNSEVAIKIDENRPFSAFVFKTIADPFVGKLSLFRVMTGKLNSDMTVYNAKKDKNEKIGSMYFLKGKQQTPASEIIAGDLGAVAKLQFTSTGDTLCEASYPIVFEDIKFPQEVISKAVLPKSKNDEDKILSGLNKLLEEDPTFKVIRDMENAEVIISGMGETHTDIISCKLKSKFGVDVILQDPKIPYRETIKKVSDVQGKHKKQSGGHGQYGDVKIKFEPRLDGEDDLEFVDKIVGGVVPRQYIPAVEKGLRECISQGVLAGYPVIRLRATLHDGSFHPVDSSEMAFKTAASIAYKKGLLEAEPVLLEPVVHLEVSVPEYYMGDIIGDINKKRGRVLGMNSSGGNQVIIAEVPQAEIFRYATDLRSMTQARGDFTMRFERYEEVPPAQASKIIESSKKLKVKDE